MKTNRDLEDDVSELEPQLTSASIVVAAKDGIVTLNETVEGLSKKTEAEAAEAAGTVAVKAVVKKIEGQTGSQQKSNDNEIAAEVVNALKWNWNTGNATIRVKVENGWVTLSGELEWNDQKEAAKSLVINLIGVKGVVNNISLISQTDIIVSKVLTERALKSHTGISSADISVQVKDRKITLIGKVDSWFQKELAGRIAWKSPGILDVCNLLTVTYEQNEKTL